MFIPAGLPGPVVEELRTAFLRVQNQVAGQWVWQRLLSPNERAKLGNDLWKAWSRGNTVQMWMDVHGVSALRAVMDLNVRMKLMDEETQRWLLVETGEMSDNPEEALAIALTKFDLVVSESPRSVYWNGNQIEIDWYNRVALWTYFLTLARAAKKGAAIDAFDFPNGNRDYHVKQKSKLIGNDQFPGDLADLIETKKRRQVLNVPRDRICVLEVVTKETVREFV